MRTIKIGRSSTNDCVFTNPSVSKLHAVLTVDADGQHGTLKDLASTNGTFVNGYRIQADTKVSYTDKIRFGSEETTLGGILEKVNKTVIKETPRLNQRSIGKSPDNQIVLNYNDVSRKHAILYKDSNGNIVIEDTNSTNGTYVNGVRITSKVLQRGDKVTITRNYPLNWENVFSPGGGHRRSSNFQWAKPAIALLSVLVLCVAGYFVWKNMSSWDRIKIYEEYNSAVCWINFGYGYRVLVDGEDMTANLYNGANLIYVSGNQIVLGIKERVGTGFFISKDGKIATNLHIARPWLFEQDSEIIKQNMNKRLANLGAILPTFNRSTVEVEGVMVYMGIIPNGLPVTQSNLIECREIKGHNDTNKDVAVLQTTTLSLPERVTTIIDINKADASEEAIKVGKIIFTIGFPFGTNYGTGVTDNQELRNQAHEGAVTQDRGEYEFGHDAETAGGASGSPVLNDKGRLVGIHNAGLSGVIGGTQGFNRAIKVKHLLELLGK